MVNCTSKSTRVFLLDDHPAVRQGLSILFSQSGYTVCGEAGSIAETLANLEQAQPNIVLVDISLENENGFDLLEELRKRDIRSLVYSMHCDAVTIEKAFKAGASGYITKRDRIDALMEGVDDVMTGRRHVSSTAARALAEKVLTQETDNPDNVLSAREQTILGQLRQGKSTAEISQALNISPRTVESYYARIIDKLKLDGMKSLRRYVFNGARET